MVHSSRLIVGTLVGVAAAAIAGCGQAGPKLYPVHGELTVSGKPAAHALVFLHRAGRTDPNEAVPYGRVGEDGRFAITTRKDGDGALPGEYLVTVFWPDMSKPEDGNGQRPDALNGAYDKPSESKLKTVVKEGDNTMAPLDLTAGKPRRVVRDPNDK